MTFWLFDAIGIGISVITSSIAPLHSFDYDNGNEEQHEFFCHVITLVSHATVIGVAVI